MSTESIERAPAATVSQSGPPSRRLLSLDALRGFDMLWIVGGEEVIHALHKAAPGGAIDLLDQQFTHKAWEGVAFYDLIFPLFVFIVGVSLVFSLSKTIEQSGRAAACRKVFVRSVLLYLLGIIYYGGLSKSVQDIRLLGVLQRIALCYLFAGLLFCLARRRSGPADSEAVDRRNAALRLGAVCAALLLGYWSLVVFVQVPGTGAGH